VTARQAVRPVADAVSELLQRLRAGASTEELEQVVRQARAVATGTQDDDRLSTALADALAVHDVLSTRRRREQELAALYETAGDLSSLRDLDQVLAAIVGRAHGLLGTDATYLMLIDEPRALTRMCVTEGITTEAFKRTELALGAGLGGLVAATGHPYATSDYAADTRFVHTIDDLVGGEGLVAILGVPLKRGSRVIGVLFAADRHRRPFSDDEVALLGSLAHHAAIALENATLFDELRQALDDLRAASAHAAAASDAIERAAQVHERLTALVLGGRGLPELALAVVEVLGGALLVLSQHGRLLASAGSADSDLWRAVTAAGDVGGQDVSAEPLQVLASSDDARRAVRLTTTSGEPLVVAPVVAASESLGVLVSVGRQLDDTEVRSLERAALVTALLLLNERSVAEAEERVRGELLDDLLSVPHADVGGLLRRAARLGIDLDRPHVVALCVPEGDGDRRAHLAAASSLAAARGGVAGAHQGRVVILLPAGTSGLPADLARTLRSTVGRPVTVGAAGPASGPTALAAAFRDALRCHDVLVTLGRSGQGAGPDDLGVYGLLFSQAGREELTGFVRRTVGPVIDYDERRGSELVRTLVCWFQHDGNLARTAGELFVHVNTLYQRLDRVAALLGKDWRHGDQALQVHLALKLHLALPAEGERT
jgi:sugar diacid utilization regulator